MKPKLYLITLICLVVAFSSAFSQCLIVFEQTTSESYLVSWDQNPQGSGKLTNQIIEGLARGNQKSVYATEYTFTYDIYSRITEKAPSKFEVLVSLKNPRLQGDVFYRGFDATQALLPSEANFTVYVLDPQGGVTKKQAFLSTPLTEYPAPMAVIQLTDTSGKMDKHKVEIREKLFFYRNMNVQQFSERTEFIDAYYTAGDILDQISGDLGTIRPNDYDHIQEQNQRLVEIEQNLRNMDQQDFPGLLPLNGQNDFIQLVPRMQNAKDKARLLRTRMDETFAQLPTRFVERGRSYLQAGNEQAAINDFNKAIELNGNFAPAHLELALIDFQRGNFPAVEQAVRNILSGMNPDPLTREATGSLGRDLYAMYVEKGHLRLDNQEFSSALEEYEAALNICRDIQEVPCDPALMTGMSSAKKGIYSRFLAKAQSHLDAGELEQALAEAENAKQFRVANTQDITDPTRENQLFDFIHGAQYRKNIQLGKDMMGMEKFRQALQLFDFSFAMEETHNIVRDPDLPGLRKQAAKPVTLGLAEEGLFHVQNNQLDRARVAGEKVKDNIALYGLGDDPEVLAKYEVLKSKIFSQECTNAQNEYNRLLTEALALIEKQDFIAAEEQLKAAGSVIAENASCGLDGSEAGANLTRIADAAEYQRKMREIDSKVNRNMNFQAIQDLESADRFFRNKNIDRFGLQHPSVFDYIDGTGSKELHLSGAQYYANKKEPELALSLLRKLAGWGFPKGRMKFVQKDVGAQMAIQEHALNPSGNPKTVVEKYYRGNKGLKHFRKAFIKQWKKL